MNCPLCKIVEEGSPSDLIRLKRSVVILADNQIFRGKCIVILNHHAEDLTKLPAKERNEFYEETLKVAEALEKVLKPDRMNYALLGNTAPHLHWHVIPRYRNDPNWEGPPWPHGELKLVQKEKIKLIEKIRNELR